MLIRADGQPWIYLVVVVVASCEGCNICIDSEGSIREEHSFTWYTFASALPSIHQTERKTRSWSDPGF